MFLAGALTCSAMDRRLTWYTLLRYYARAGNRATTGNPLGAPFPFVKEVSTPPTNLVFSLRVAIRRDILFEMVEMVEILLGST